MDIIHSCLALAPVPYLSTAFSVFRFIWFTVEQVQASHQQLRTLAQCIAQLLQTIDDEYRAKRLVAANTSVHLKDLEGLLDEVSFFVQKQATHGFLKLILTKGERIGAIEEYHRRITFAVHSFQIPALLNIQQWQSRNDDARMEDQRILDDRLSGLEKDQNQLREALDAQHNNVMAMMVSLQRHLHRRSAGDQEHKFLSHSLRYLSTSSGSQVQIEDWMITSFEVDFGPEIGSGGFGRVYKGHWHKTEVALKVLKSETGVTPSSKSIRREIATWSKIRHPHILQFLGANVLDEKPFIVMPYMKNGNARDYIQDHPDCNRLKILHHVALGLVYLHAQTIIHGDLKALNVLIDNSENALLCDFGLSRMKGDTTSRTGDVGGAGTRNWMAPEQLMGKSLRRPCDIYAYGMTIYEIYADEVPLGHVGFVNFFELVVHQDVRPERPDPDDAPGLSDETWELAEQCWVKDPLKRPNANAVCDVVSRLLDISPTTRVAHVDLPISTPQLSRLSPHLPSPGDSPPQSVSLAEPPSTNEDIPTLLPTDPPTFLSPLLPSPSEDPPPLQSVGPAEFLRIDDNTQSELRDHQPIPLTQLLPVSSVSTAEPRVVDTQVVFRNDLPVSTLEPSSSPPQLPSPPDSPPLPRSSSANLPHAHTKSQASLHSDLPILSPRLSVPHPHRLSAAEKSSSPRSSRVEPLRIGDKSKQALRADWPLPTRKSSFSLRSLFTNPLPRPVSIKPIYNPVRTSGFEAANWAGLPPKPRVIQHASQINSIAFSPDGHRIVSGGYDRIVWVWDATTGKCISGPFEGHTDWVWSVAFSPDGQSIASGSYDKTVRLWDATSGKSLTSPLVGHTNSVKSVAFSPDGEQIASGSNDYTIRVWDVKTGECVYGPFEGHPSWVQSIAFSPDGRRIASGSLRTIYVWDVLTGDCVYMPFDGRITRVKSIAFSPDGEWIASGADDNTIRVWHVQTGRCVSGILKGHTDDVNSVAFSPDGQWLASGSDDNTIRVWDVKTGRCVSEPFRGHLDWVWSVIFSPDGKSIASGSDDGTIRIWACK